MESALDVLSRAATMVQDNANEARLTTKELPTTKWRRDRRLRTGEYHAAHHHSASSTSATSTSSSANSPPGSPPPPTALSAAATTHLATAHSSYLNAAAATAAAVTTTSPQHMSLMTANAAALISQHHNMESPIDMSVTSTTLKHQHRSSPPPPYREPLPGSSYVASTLARPSVITQAPPKRDLRDSILIANRENDNRSSDSSTMCENVIDEHFRRSLGADYAALFGKKSPNATPSPQPLLSQVAAPVATTTPAPTPPPPAAAATIALAAHTAHQLAAPPYHHPTHHHHHHVLPHPQALISPKPTAVLLSPTAMAAAATAQLKSEPLSPGIENRNLAAHHIALPPPQQQPLSLHRSNSPQRPTANNSPQPIAMTTTQRLMQAKTNSPASPTAAPLSPALQQPPTTTHLPCIEQLTSTHTPSPPPAALAPPTVAATAAVRHASPAAAALVAAPSMSPTPNAIVPAIMRIKSEPGLTMATNTPPASPTSSSNASISTNSDILASVDDHFAKALGDTWKKLQENKELRK